MKAGASGIMALLQRAPINNSGLGPWATLRPVQPTLTEVVHSLLMLQQRRLSQNSNPLTFQTDGREDEDQYVTGPSDEIFPT